MKVEKSGLYYNHLILLWQAKINPTCFVVVLLQITPLVIDILFHLCDLEHRRGYVQPDAVMATHSSYNDAVDIWWIKSHVI